MKTRLESALTAGETAAEEGKLSGGLVGLGRTPPPAVSVSSKVTDHRTSDPGGDGVLGSGPKLTASRAAAARRSAGARIIWLVVQVKRIELETLVFFLFVIGNGFGLTQLAFLSGSGA